MFVNRLNKNRITGCLPGVLLLVAVILCAGCSVEDERDLCCYAGNVMRYMYRPHDKDEFRANIHRLRHFLFDSEGCYLREMENGDDIQQQPINMEEGRYTMVTVGNMSVGSSVNHEENRNLESLILVTRNPFRSMFRILTDTLDNGDELFWGVRHFDIDHSGTINDFGPDCRWQDYTVPVTEMSNIHCHLTVRVEWNSFPEYMGEYEMELSGVPVSYNLNPGNARKAGGFLIPSHDRTGVHRMHVPLEGFELYSEFITLRYTDDTIPMLRIYHGEEQIGPDIDLKQAFRKWGWYPSQIHVQEYSIHIRLYGDGRAEVTPVFDGSVSDWINGGTFG